MIDINTAVKITERKQKKCKKDTTEKDYQRFLKYLSKKIIKACKKGNFDYCFDATCERKILDRLKIDLNNNGYKVNIHGPFYGLDVYWEIRVSWEEWGRIKMSENEIDYKQKYNDLIAHIPTTPFITSPMGDLPVTSTTVRNLLDKLIKTEEENHSLSKQLYDLNIYINTIEEIQNNSTKHLVDLIKKDIPEEYHKQIDETTNIFLGVQNGKI